MGNGEEKREIIFKALSNYFGNSVEVVTKKRTATGSHDDFLSADMYNPELDIWVGPTNMKRNIQEDNKSINQALHKYGNFLRDLNQLAEKPYNEDCLNKNPRFFLAIEVGGSGSKKHLLGEMFNVSILGKIGIIISANNETHATYMRHYNYIDFAQNVDKIPNLLGNIMIIKSDVVLDYLKNNKKYGK